MHRRILATAMIALSACATGSAVVPPIAALAPSFGDPTVDGLLALNALCSAEDSGLATANPNLKLADGMGTGGFKVGKFSTPPQGSTGRGQAVDQAKSLGRTNHPLVGTGQHR